MTEELSQEEGWIIQLLDGADVSAGSKICGLTTAGRKGLVARLAAIVAKQVAAREPEAEPTTETAVPGWAPEQAHEPVAVPRWAPNGQRGRWQYG